MSESLKLGHLITDTQYRDAVHVAVAPVTAGEDVRPGWHVGMFEDGTVGDTAPNVGIIDPFLQCKVVRKGQRCWLFLYPGSIQSLRHAWTHPAFPNEINVGPTKAESLEYLKRTISGRCVSLTVDDFIKLVTGHDAVGPHDAEYGRTFVVDDEYLHANGVDASGDIPSAVWVHVENIAGKPVIYRPKYFSCSC